MSFDIGLSGMRAASKDLNVTGNNIANAGTIGFKQSRAEFADVYAASMNNSSMTSSGVQLNNISQLFMQGNITATQNPLDLAISGSGFFQVSKNGNLSYTRAGYFGVDKQGNIINNLGANLQGYVLDGNGNVLEGTVGNLKIQTTALAPKATSQVSQIFNLNSADQIPLNAATFDPTDPLSYNSSTSTNIYDSQGNAHVMSQYFVKTGANTWDMKILIDGRSPDDAVAEPPVAASIPLTFTADGQLDQTALAAATLPAGFAFADGQIAFSGWDPAELDSSVDPAVWIQNGAATPATFNLDLRSTTQYSSYFAVNSVSQDGYTSGDLSSIDVAEDGKIYARYTNGQSQVQGQVMLVKFANEQGLIPVGNSQWVESVESGEPVRNPPGVGSLGLIQSAALEESNVELTEQLVDLIVAQRNYQANAKSIQTESDITQIILDMR